MRLSLLESYNDFRNNTILRINLLKYTLHKSIYYFDASEHL